MVCQELCQNSASWSVEIARSPFLSLGSVQKFKKHANHFKSISILAFWVLHSFGCSMFWSLLGDVPVVDPNYKTLKDCIQAATKCWPP